MARKELPSEGVKAIELRLREARDRRCEPMRQAARQALAAMEAKRTDGTTAAETSGRPKKPKKTKSYKSKRTVLSEAQARSEVNKAVTPEAQRNGDYRYVAFKLQEVTEGGKRIEKEVRVVRNLGGTPIERWHSRGALDERQMQAIMFYQQAWRIHIGEQRVTANYSPSVARGLKTAVELWANSRMAAKESLRLLDQEVFLREPVEHFHVWQNVVIFDEPAGIAGSRVGFVVKKSAEAAARVIVGSMAHKIADVVIDQSRRDFGDLLLDLDAPRRPGRR